MTTLVRLWNLPSRWNSKAPPEALNGIGQFAQDHEVEFGQAFGDLSGFSCSRALASPIVEKKRAFRWRCSMARMPSVVAAWVLPVPGPPIRTMFWAPSMNSHLCSWRTVASLNSLVAKSKPERSF